MPGQSAILYFSSSPPLFLPGYPFLLLPLFFRERGRENTVFGPRKWRGEAFLPSYYYFLVRRSKVVWSELVGGSTFLSYCFFFSRPLQPLSGEQNVYLRIARFPLHFWPSPLFSVFFYRADRNKLFPLSSSEKHISQLSLFSSLSSSSVAISFEANKTHLLRPQNNIQ